MKLHLTIVAFLALVQIKGQSHAPDSSALRLLDLEYSLWQAPSDSMRLDLLTEKAFIYRQQQNYRSAIKEIERGVTFIHDSSDVSAKWRYEALSDYFLASEFAKASVVLETFSSAQAKNIRRQKEYFYLRWSVFNEMGDWQKCKSEMLALSVNLQDTALSKEINKLSVEVKQKNPDKARRMSAFLPGLGSVYAGYPIRGITSFLISGGLIGLTAYLAVNELYFTALVSGILPLLKFYSGNKRLSENLVYRRNAQNNLTLKKKYNGLFSALIMKIEK